MCPLRHKTKVSIGNRLRDLREDNDYTQKEMAAILYCSQQTYSRYEKEEIKIDIHSLSVLAKFYNVSLDYLACLTNDKKVYYTKN